ncbi:MAG TPA: zinc-binding dehydrogenase [Phycisphaerales bacterium]|nr:zinc-binding dehydrogenase [Phycisphaerales bacterium]
MRAIVLTRRGTPVTPNIEFQTGWKELEAPKPGEAVIRTLTSAFNHMDLWVGMGLPGIDGYPRITGCDACGVVESVAPGVNDKWVGQRVIVNAAYALPERQSPGDPPGSSLAPQYELIGEHVDGMFRERFTAPVANLAPVGDADPIEAAAFGLCFLTAYSGLVTKANLRPGQTLLVTGIGGGVATSALAIGKWLGCSVAVTSRHQWKLDAAAKLGADLGVLDKGQDWSKELRAWTDKRGVDACYDSTGKATHLNAIKSLARGGAYVSPGATTGGDATGDLTRLFWNQLRILGTTMGTNDEFREVTALLRAGRLKPVVDRVFKPEQAKEAYARLEAAEQFGKIVIDWR